MADETTTAQSASTSEGEGKNQAQGAGETTATQTAGTETTTPEARFTQADLDRILKDRLAEDRKRHERAAAEAKAVEQGEWQKLATEREAELTAVTTERDTLKADNEALTGALTAEVDARLKTLPKEILELKPESASPVELLAWTRKAEKAKPVGQLPPAGGRSPGVGDGKREPSQEDRDRHRQHVAARF